MRRCESRHLRPSNHPTINSHTPSPAPYIAQRTGNGVRRGIRRPPVRTSFWRRLEKLDPVAEGIIDVDAQESREWFVALHGNSGRRDLGDQRRQIGDEEGGMRLASRDELLVDPQMDLEIATLEPNAAASGK